MNTIVEQRIDKVRSYLQTSTKVIITEELNLLDSGVLDSMALVDLIGYMEELTEASIDTTSLVAEDFRNLVTIRDRFLGAPS